MGKKTITQVQEAQKVPSRMKPREGIHHHVVIKIAVTVILPKVLGHTTARLNLLK